MLESPCPRCGEPSTDGLCGRCVAYVLRFEPFLLRPGLPGPAIDREARPPTAWLTLSPSAPVRFGKPSARREDDAFAIQFLRHLGLPDGGKAVLTREDRATLHRLLRRWARAPPVAEPLRGMVRALYAEAASLADLPAPIAAEFRSLAGPPAVVEETAGPAPPPISIPAPERAPNREVAPAMPLPPPPPPPPPEADEAHVLTELRVELDSKKEELARLLADQRQEMDRRAGMVESQLQEVQRREALIAEKDRAVGEAERRLEARAVEFQRQASEIQAGDAKRSLFFRLFSMEGVGRETAKALSEAFVTEERIRTATASDLAAVPNVPPEEAARIRDAFSGGEAPARRDLREKVQEMLEDGETEAAVEVFDELTRLNPEDIEAWTNRGELLATLGQTDEAIASYEKVLELDRDQKAARSELANLLFENGDFGAAAANLQDLFHQAPEQVGDWLRRAATLLDDGKMTEATLVYNAVLDGDPQNLTAGLALGDLLLAMGDADSADREYTRALQHHPDDPEALLKKGLLLNRQGRWGAAVQLFNRAISVRWDYRDAWAAKGQVLLAQGKSGEALECFDRLVAFDDRRHDGWLGKAEAHLALGENNKAAEAAGRALALDKGNKHVQELLERLRESTDHPREGAEVVSPPPQETFDAGVLIEMADALLDTGDPESAIRAYNEILSQNPKDARAWFGKGRSLHGLERYGEAVRCFTAAVENDPASAEYTRWLAVCEERWRKEGA